MKPYYNFIGDKMLVKNENYIIDIDSVTQEGMGVGRIDGFVVFTYGLLPGEKAQVKIIKLTKSYAIGKLLDIITASPNRLESPVCHAYPQCGGCCFCHVDYKSQLDFKTQYVKDCLERIGRLDVHSIEFVSTFGMQEPKEYRNKYTYVFTENNGKIDCGFYAANSHRVVAIDGCIIETKQARLTRLAMTEFVNIKNLSVYNEMSGKGLLRNLMVRFGDTDVCVIVVINGKKFPFTNEFINYMREKCPWITSLFVNINTIRTNVVLGETFHLLYGKSYMDASIGSSRYKVSPQAFFQINPLQTKVLYDKVYNLSGVQDGDTIYDLFCGAGTIGIYVKNRFLSENPDSKLRLVGVEYVPEAVENARENAALNGLDNCRFYAGDATVVTPQIIAQEQKMPDLVIVDPPRSGLDEKLLDTVCLTGAKRVVYVSCNPSTMARDVKYLTAGGYCVKKVEMVDMFPWTGHVESVVCLSREKADDYICISVQTKDLQTKAN